MYVPFLGKRKHRVGVIHIPITQVAPNCKQTAVINSKVQKGKSQPLITGAVCILMYGFITKALASGESLV